MMTGPANIRWSRALRIALWLVPSLWLVDHLLPPINHDVALLLRAAERMLDGERLYVDIVDINPPLTIWLSALPPLAARTLGILDIPTWSSLITIALVVASAVATRATLGRGVETPRAADLAGAAVLFILAALPGQDFGQREHLVLAATFPYLALAAGRAGSTAVGGGLPLAVVLAVGIAFAMKPWFLVLPLAVELAVLARRPLRVGLRDPLPWLLGAVMATTALLTVLVAPDYLEIAVPLAIEAYAPLRQDWWAVFVATDLAWALAAWACLAAAALFWSRTVLATVVAAATLAAFAIPLGQGMGWSYHLLPVVGLLAWLAVLVGIEVHRRRPIGNPAVTIAVAVVAAGAFVILVPNALMTPFARPAPYENSPGERIEALIESHGDDAPVLALSVLVWPFYPAINYAESGMAMRYFSLWPIRGLYRTCPPPGRTYRAPAEMSATERRVFETVAEDFAAMAPALVFVQTDWRLSRCRNQPFDFLAYFRRHPAFERAFRNYRPLTTVDNIAVYHRAPLPVHAPWSR